MTHILGIGIATLDIINTVDGYPAEDAEVRALSQRICRGGNVTNTLVVLSQLGHESAWAGVLADEPDAAHILDDLKGYQVDVSRCRVEARGKVPTSYVVLNRRNGSRTIVHYRELREYGFADFHELDLSAFGWLHFEGRNVPETARMLAHAKVVRPDLPISVEIEKPRPQIDILFAHTDLLLCSRGYAQHRGFDEPDAFLRDLRTQAVGPELICTWGGLGAWGMDRQDRIAYSPAFPPPSLVDALGAGDTFNAGIIDARMRGLPLRDAIAAACRLAGRKCGQEGFAELADPTAQEGH